MPDTSTVYTAVTLEADNGDRLHSYPIDTGPAESQKTSDQYSFTEHLVFYPVEISRCAVAARSWGWVVHV